MAATPLSYAVLDVPNISQKSSFVGIFRTFEGLEVNVDVYEYREGGNNDTIHRLPGRISYPNLRLSWGLVDDDALLRWFAQTHTQAQTQEITLTLAATPSDLSGHARKFTFADAFPVQWSGPQLSGGPAGWIETLEIAHSGLKLPS
jgi:phage tail-like protein